MQKQQEQQTPESIAASAAEAAEEQDRREEGRVSIFHQTEVRSLGEAYPATIRNMSRWGVMAECADPLRTRSYIYVVLPGVGSLPARVTWVREGRFGANLLEPITDEHFERLVRILPSGPTRAAA